jgi:hypothetical protein
VSVVRATGLAGLVLLASGLAGATACKKNDPPPPSSSSSTTSAAQPSSGASGAIVGATGATGSASVVAESLPRCRVDGARVAVPGDDVVAGDAVTTADALLVGVVRREGARRLASVVRASLDLASVKMIDVGATLGDDPPPSPRLRGSTVFVASYARSAGDAGVAAATSAGSAAADRAPGTMSRKLEIARLDGTALVHVGSVVQQADESLAYDVEWPKDGNAPPLVAWDEDAPLLSGQMLADRGVVKVQILGAGKPRVASPDTSDAEAPRLLARRGGYWLAWLARRVEVGEDAGPAAEGPGERRAYRWVELVALDAKGEPTSQVRRVTPEKGRVASFDLAAGSADAGGDPRLVVVVQDEAAISEGAGERILRYTLDAQKDRVEAGDLLDGGVGHALADLLPLPSLAAVDAGAPRWLSFTDPAEHAHLVPLGAALGLAGAPTLEPSLDGARIVASGPPGDVVYAIGPGAATGVELRRLVCR